MSDDDFLQELFDNKNDLTSFGHPLSIQIPSPLSISKEFSFVSDELLSPHSPDMCEGQPPHKRQRRRSRSHSITSLLSTDGMAPLIDEEEGETTGEDCDMRYYDKMHQEKEEEEEDNIEDDSFQSNEESYYMFSLSPPSFSPPTPLSPNLHFTPFYPHHPTSPPRKQVRVGPSFQTSTIPPLKEDLEEEEEGMRVREMERIYPEEESESEDVVEMEGEELELFERGLRSVGRKFHLISSLYLPQYTPSSLTHFYYSTFKKSGTYMEWKGDWGHLVGRRVRRELGRGRSAFGEVQSLVHQHEEEEETIETSYPNKDPATHFYLIKWWVIVGGRRIFSTEELHRSEVEDFLLPFIPPPPPSSPLSHSPRSTSSIDTNSNDSSVDEHEGEE